MLDPQIGFAGLQARLVRRFLAVLVFAVLVIAAAEAFPATGSAAPHRQAADARLLPAVRALYK